MEVKKKECWIKWQSRVRRITMYKWLEVLEIS